MFSIIEIYKVFNKFTYEIQSMMGQTDKQRVHPVQSSVTCGICVSGSNLKGVLYVIQRNILNDKKISWNIGFTVDFYCDINKTQNIVVCPRT